MGRNFETVGT